MTYWWIALIFFVVSFIAANYSMWKHEVDLNLFHGSIERTGICFVISVAWPLSLIAVIAWVISGVMKGTENEPID